MKPSDRLSWFVEVGGVTLWDRHGGKHLSIPYPHAGLWALIANGNYSKAYAVELMRLLMPASRKAAQHEVEATLSAWTGLGLISRG
jgi:hypothetical protein